MNKQMNNHHRMLNKVIDIIKSCGITSNTEDTMHYRKLEKDKSNCHIEIYGISYFPIKLKIAYAENEKSNQAERYTTQVNRWRDEATFIYSGLGWNKQSYKRVLSELKGMIGSDHVLTLEELTNWLNDCLKGKESH